MAQPKVGKDLFENWKLHSRKGKRRPGGAAFDEGALWLLTATLPVEYTLQALATHVPEHETRIFGSIAAIDARTLDCFHLRNLFIELLGCQGLQSLEKLSQETTFQHHRTFQCA
jgi:hypothetical protein